MRWDSWMGGSYRYRSPIEVAQDETKNWDRCVEGLEQQLKQARRGRNMAYDRLLRLKYEKEVNSWLNKTGLLAAYRRGTAWSTRCLSHGATTFTHLVGWVGRRVR